MIGLTGPSQGAEKQNFPIFEEQRRGHGDPAQSVPEDSKTLCECSERAIVEEAREEEEEGRRRGR